MISFRNHVVSLVAVLLALAAGVALGGGPLSDVGRGALSSATTDAEPPTTAEGFGDRFAEATARKLYAGGLDTRPVAVLTLPGADEDLVGALGSQVEEAGGEVTATFALSDGMVAPGEKSLVDTLGSQLMTQLGKGDVDGDAPTYERMGQVLARSLASTRANGEPSDATATSVAQSLAGAELVSGPKSLPKRAPLVLLVTGDDVDDDVLSGLLAGLASRSVGVVATGPTDASDLDALRTSPAASRVATVDGAETGPGRVATTLALIRSLTTQGGAFGASGSDGAVPLG